MTCPIQGEKEHDLAVVPPELIPCDEDMFAVEAQQRESTWYADSMLRAFEQTQDPCGDECEKLLTRLEARLWNPVYEMTSSISCAWPDSDDVDDDGHHDDDDATDVPGQS